MLRAEFIGGGRVTRIILGGLKRAGVELDVKVYDPNPFALKELSKIVSVKVLKELSEIQGDFLVLAVPHSVMLQVLRQLKGKLKDDAVVLSVAPKYTIEQIGGILSVKNVVRMVPHAASIINRGYNPVSFSKLFDRKNKKAFLDIFSSLGKTPEVEEKELEVYAVICAMLPTYFWFQYETLENIGQELGLDEKKAKEAVFESTLSALTLFYKSELSRKEVKDLIAAKPLKSSEELIREIYEKELLKTFKQIAPESKL